MALFFMWMAVLSAGLTAYCVLLWRKNRTGSRFKARLTILFLLFVLVPVIPLTLFLAHLMTQSANLLLLPGISEALEGSLSTLRSQLEDRGRHFLAAHPDPGRWDLSLLRGEGVAAAAEYRAEAGGVRVRSKAALPDYRELEAWRPPADAFASSDSAGFSSVLHLAAGRPAISVFRRSGPKAWTGVSYAVPADVTASKIRIQRAMEVYSTLSLLKESLIEKRIVWAFAVLLILALAVLSVRAAKILSRGISGPVVSLVEGMRRVASGDFRTPVRTRAGGEFQFLVESFNRMVAELRDTRESLIRAERVAAWQEVARRISHEMKNGLSPMTVDLRRLRQRLDADLPAAETRGLVASLEEEMESLKRMASEFSEFARLPRPELRPASLNDVARNAVRLARSAHPVVVFEIELDPDVAETAADTEQVKRALSNLLRNAAEASAAGDTVTVRTMPESAEPGGVRLEVEDRGAGMDAETLARLFTPYFTTKSGGTGLGLVIVEKIVKDHGGDIQVRSEPGRGTCVSLRFPAAPSA